MKKPIQFANFWDDHPTLKYHFTNRSSFCAWMSRHGFGDKDFFNVKQIIELRKLSKTKPGLKHD